MAGKFEVYEDRSGKFRFRLKAANGQIVATGEAYETRSAAKRGCESVQRAALSATVAEDLVGSSVSPGSAPAPVSAAPASQATAPRGQRLVEAARRREAVAEALASVRAEGLEPTLHGLELLEGIAAGEVSEDAAIEALTRHHRQ